MLKEMAVNIGRARTVFCLDDKSVLPIREPGAHNKSQKVPCCQLWIMMFTVMEAYHLSHLMLSVQDAEMIVSTTALFS